MFLIIICAVLSILSAIIGGVFSYKKGAQEMGGDWESQAIIAYVVSAIVMIFALAVAREYRAGTPKWEGTLAVNEIYEVISSANYMGENFVILLNREGQIKMYEMKTIKTPLPKVFKVVKRWEYESYPPQ